MIKHNKTDRFVVLSFLAGFVICVLLGEFAFKYIPEMCGWRFKSYHSLLPDEKEYYLDVDRGGIGHYILYYALNSSTKYAKKADVLILGNSRSMFGFSSQRLKSFSQHTGIHFYHFGFGWDENVSFPMQIIRRHDLRPPIVIVNTDRFFTNRISPVAQQVMQASLWKAEKKVMEKQISWKIKKHLYKIFPHFLDTPYRHIIFRSITDGSWMPISLNKPFPDRPFSVNPERKYSLPEEDLRIAAEFKAEMNSRNTAVVLTLVPSPRSNYKRAEQLAKKLQVPLIAPILENMATIDDSHLTHENAKRFTAAFLDEFKELTLVKKMIKNISNKTDTAPVLP